MGVSNNRSQHAGTTRGHLVALLACPLLVAPRDKREEPCARFVGLHCRVWLPAEHVILFRLWTHRLFARPPVRVVNKPSETNYYNNILTICNAAVWWCVQLVRAARGGSP